MTFQPSLNQNRKKVIAWSLLVFSLAFGSMAQAEVLSFKDWKALRIEEAKTNLEKIRTEMGSGPAVRPESSVRVNRAEPKRMQSTKSLSARLVPSNSSQQKLQQAELNLEISQDLAVNDYFVLYLSQFKTLSAFLDAAKKMSPEESAELMMAYKRQLVNSDQVKEIEPGQIADVPKAP